MKGLYPIIRRKRRPLVADAPPANSGDSPRPASKTDETEIVATMSMLTIVSPSVPLVPTPVPLPLPPPYTEAAAQRDVQIPKRKRTKIKDATDPSSLPTS